nr:uncharacterized mitochondrial protein AtMg00810-like [Tanacetum cinerariifolium]
MIVKKIFKYLKGHLKLDLWYARESPLVLEAYSNSDYAGANKDRKSTTGGCQFLGRRLISWQCKKQTIVATSSTEAEYVVAANCCGQVLWIQNQLLDYGLMVQDGGLVVFKCSTWTMWPYFDDKAFILVVQVFPLVFPESPELGPLTIQATIDETPYTINEDLVRSHLQLADDGDEPLGGSFHMSPPRSTQAPPAGQTLGGAEDLITLTALSSVVSTLVQKVNTLKTKLKDHKKLFKDVVGKLVKKVKAIEVKLKTMKRKMVVSDSNQEEGGKQDVDLDALLALANAAVTVDSNISPGGASNNPAASTSVPADVLTSVAPAGVSNKGKTPMDAKRLHDEEQAQVDRQRAELQRRRQQEVFASAMYYTEADWINIMAQVEANASLSKTLLGDDVSEDNFLTRMVALIKRKKQALAEKLATKRKDRTMTQGQQRTYMRQFVKNQSCTRRKSLGRNCLTKPKSKTKELDLDADDQTFIKVVSNEDSEDEAPFLGSALVG